jgi:L-fucose isomerase-like protein
MNGALRSPRAGKGNDTRPSETRPRPAAYRGNHMNRTTFALFFGNRGFFPASLIAGAREEMKRELNALGHDVLMLEPDATRYGAVETPQEGEIFAEFLRANRGRFGGVIVCLPNFGDETGAVAALEHAGVPIWIQAYPDEYEKMGPSLRRDSFCGKISIMDVFRQYGVKFTTMKPHTVRPGSDRFKENVDEFDRVCRVANGIKGMVVGAIGARTTPFKTVRIDEVALQRHGVTVETFDMSDVFLRMKAVRQDEDAYAGQADLLRRTASWDGVPERAFDNLVRLGVTLNGLVREARLDAVAVRCWTEIQHQMGISPCVAMGVLNDSGLAAACEVDIGNAVAMRALHLASYEPAGLLDWNNNYGDEDDKCILFHCGPMPASLMEGRGQITDHAILMSAVGEGNGFGCNTGRIKAMDFTFGSLMTDEGRVKMYLGEGRFTRDPIPPEYFGVAGVAEIPRLQDVLLHVGINGHRHHVSVTRGRVQKPLAEALGHYLNFEISLPQAG